MVRAAVQSEKVGKSPQEAFKPKSSGRGVLCLPGVGLL